MRGAGDSMHAHALHNPVISDNPRVMADTARAGSTSRWWFVTRKYPPSIGGMERLSWETTTRLSLRRPCRIVAMRPGRLGLPRFMLASALRVLRGCVQRRIAILHVGDPVLAPLAHIARAFGVPTVVTIHGLDVTCAHPVYRGYRRSFLRNFDGYVCISRRVRDAAIAAGVPADRIVVIGIGIAETPSNAPAIRDDNRLLFVGRLVKRKGVAWFVDAVLPRLVTENPRLQLAIVGDGPERTAIASAASAAGVGKHLVWRGVVDEQAKVDELSRATMCVMPNVLVPGDVEGFGIVALEAAAAACPLLASGVDGLRDAVDDGKSGLLVPPGDADAWVVAIENWLNDAQARIAFGERARRHVADHRSWDTIIDAYDKLLTRLSAAR